MASVPAKMYDQLTILTLLTAATTAALAVMLSFSSTENRRLRETLYARASGAPTVCVVELQEPRRPGYPKVSHVRDGVIKSTN